MKLPFGNTNRRGLIDLRSDTVTKPTHEMRSAMMNAEVGDDVFNEDPTVISLEEKVANLFNKESALFFPTGTMSNLASSMSWCDKRGSEIILGDKSHMFLYEQGGISQIGGITPRTLSNNRDGTIDLDLIEKSIRSSNIHFTTTNMITIENTHNVCGGRVLPVNYIESLKYLSDKNKIPIHMDGARIWNAITKLDVSPAIIGQYVDSLSVCLSKGLGAPAGSLLVGPKDIIAKARRIRKVLGGGMRQVGVLAAAGQRALDDFNLGILNYDHSRAKNLAQAIDLMPAFHVDISAVETNIILVGIIASDNELDVEVVAMLKERGVLALSFGKNLIRLVTHRDIDDDDINRAIEAFREISAYIMSKSSIHSHDNIDTTLVTSLPSNQIIKVDNPSLVLPSNQGLEQYSNLPMENYNSFNENNNNNNNNQKSGTSVEVYYEEAVIHGMSVSNLGFVVLLRGLISDRVISFYVTPADPMADGLDRDQAETAEAVTLLQLLQGIDVESYLPKNILNSKFSMDSETNTKQQIILQRVVIDNISKTKSFQGRLYGMIKTKDNVKDYDDSEYHDKSVIKSNNQADSYDILDQSSNIIDMNNSNAYIDVSDNSFHPLLRSDKEVEIKSAFEAMALALRHNAIIDIQSTLFHDDEISYSLDELQSYFPKMVETIHSNIDDTTMLSPVVNIESNNEYISNFDSVDIYRMMDRLQRQLKEAIRQRNDEKILLISKKLEFYSSIDLKKSILVPPHNSNNNSTDHNNDLINRSNSGDSGNQKINYTSDTEFITTYDINNNNGNMNI